MTQFEEWKASWDQMARQFELEKLQKLEADHARLEQELAMMGSNIAQQHALDEVFSKYMGGR